MIHFSRNEKGTELIVASNWNSSSWNKCKRRMQ